jgi:hypothetical protein
MMLGNLRIDLFRVSKFLLHEIDARQSHFHARAEPVLRQIPLDAVQLERLRVDDQNAWCPQRREALEPRRMFFNVSFEGNELLIDEVRSFLIRV